MVVQSLVLICIPQAFGHNHSQVRISEKSQEAMVIGRDITTSLGIVLDFKENVAQWDSDYMHLNTGGSHSFEVSDHEFLDESKTVAEVQFTQKSSCPTRYPTLVNKYLQLLRDNKRLYDDGH